jgi:signal transduction histidine kinase
MEHLEKFRRQISDYIFLIVFANNIVLAAGGWELTRLWHKEKPIWIAGFIVLCVVTTALLSWWSARYLTKPFRLLAQAVMHVSPNGSDTAAPDTDSIKLGQETVVALSTQIYNIATAADQLTTRLEQKNIDLHANYIATSLPLPFFVLNKNMGVVFANSEALKYLKLSENEVVGKDIYSVLHMSFNGAETLEGWINSLKDDQITAIQKWNRVKTTLNDQKTILQYDLCAYYKKDNPLGYELMIVLFDQTADYSKDDEATDYVALAVHELRNPLTLIRSYVQVIKEKMTEKEAPEIKGSVQQIDAASQQLASFINNVLNLARLDDGQFVPHFNEENWDTILGGVVKDMQLRASVRGIRIETQIAKDLPTVGVDKVSMYEVISNLLDNAIKYSPGEGDKKIIVSSSLSHDGLVETSIQDFGVGIPESTIPHLFDKFYRGHRSRAAISGTGLGLYLCHSIIGLHGGNIWVRSKEGAGSIFTFTVLPYNKMSQLQSQQEQDFHATHGSIKNHNLYRR